MSSPSENKFEFNDNYLLSKLAIISFLQFLLFFGFLYICFRTKHGGCLDIWQTIIEKGPNRKKNIHRGLNIQSHQKSNGTIELQNQMLDK